MEELEEAVVKSINAWAESRSYNGRIDRNSDLAKVYNLDSIETLDLVLTIEENFSICIPNRDIKKLFRQAPNGEYKLATISSYAPVSNLVSYIKKKTSKKFKA